MWREMKPERFAGVIRELGQRYLKIMIKLMIKLKYFFYSYLLESIWIE